MTGLEKGKSLFEKQEYSAAIETLTQFLAENPNNADALYTRAICYRRNERYEKSIEDFTAILKRLPNEPSLLCERGISHFHNKDIHAAMKDMDKAVEIEPNNPYRYSSRAYIRANIDAIGAIEDYKKAIELDPKDDIALNNLGLLEENLGRMSSAKNRFKSANKIIGYQPDKETPNKNVEEQQSVSLGKVMLDVFRSKTTRKEYFKYLKSFFQKKA